MRKKIFLVLAVILTALFVFSSPVNAAVQTLTSGDLQVTAEIPLFPGSKVWYPGLSLAKQFTVKNLGRVTHTVVIESANENQTGNLAETMTVNLGNFSGTMKNFWDSGEVNLGDLPAGDSRTFDMSIGFAPGAGNDYQNRTAGFDLVVGFLGTSEQVTVSETNGGETSGSGGGNPSANFSGAAQEVVPGFAPEVLGEQDNISTGEATRPAKIRDVKGAETAACQNCFWWPLLLIQFMAITLYFWISVRPQFKGWLIPAVISLAIYPAFWYLNRNCLSAGVCRYFWILDIAILVISRFLSRKLRE